ncbi:MAG: hypothetical protein ACI4EA_08515, partial [Candidatus Ornithomonoglobus sp.]
MIKKCVICGAEFAAPPSSKKITCSRECNLIRRSQSHRGKSNVWSEAALQRATERAAAMTPEERERRRDIQKTAVAAAAVNPLAGRYETNASAKQWHLIDPSGKDYYVRNLLLWARENCELFGFTPSDENAARIAAGFRTVKYCLKKNSPTARAKSYKGWTVIVDD